MLKLCVDRQAKQLVSFNGSVTSIPNLFQSNTPTVRVTVVDPTGGLNPQYQAVDLSGYGLRCSIGDTPTGSSGGPTPLALQDTFTWFASGSYFEADLALNVAAIDAFIGSAASKGAYFELNLTGSGGRETILQVPFQLSAVVDELTSTSPTPTDQYLTKAEVQATYAPLVGVPGGKIVLKSPNGLYAVELGCNDDGTFGANVITL